jgi:hypothetical protein
MRIDGIAIGDIVKASIGGRVIYGEVLEIRDRIVYFNPISRGSGWRHANAGQIVGHWRKAGRRRPGDSADGVVQPPEQLALKLSP